MKRSATFMPKFIESGKSKEALSLQMLIRGGFVRKQSDGVFIILPLGKRILLKMQKEITKSLEQLNGMEISFPILKTTNNENVEEIVLTVEKDDYHLNSYNDESMIALLQQELDENTSLPLLFYQIDKAFQNEISGKGFLQAKEYLLNEVHIFYEDNEEGKSTYENVLNIYKNILLKLGLNYRIVQGLSRLNKKAMTEEIIVISDEGNETIVYSDTSNYAANRKIAQVGYQEVEVTVSSKPIEKISVEDVKSLNELLEARSLSIQDYIKGELYKIDGEFTMVLTRGDHTVNEWKLKQLLDAKELKLSDARQVKRILNCTKNFIGPLKLPLDMKVVADLSVKQMKNVVACANEEGFFYENVNPNRDFAVNVFGDIRLAKGGDPSPVDDGTLFEQKGFKVGEIVHYPLQNDCQLASFHVNLTQLFAIMAEQYHDANGFKWPKEISPYQIDLIVKDIHDHVQINLADELYNIISFYQFEVLYDDRDIAFDAKIKEGNLIGSPIHLTIGERAEEGMIEVFVRNTGEFHQFSKEELIDWLTEFFRVQ